MFSRNDFTCSSSWKSTTPAMAPARPGDYPVSPTQAAEHSGPAVTWANGGAGLGRGVPPRSALTGSSVRPGAATLGFPPIFTLLKCLIVKSLPLVRPLLKLMEIFLQYFISTLWLYVIVCLQSFIPSSVHSFVSSVIPKSLLCACLPSACL